MVNIKTKKNVKTGGFGDTCDKIFKTVFPNDELLNTLNNITPQPDDDVYIQKIKKLYEDINKFLSKVGDKEESCIAKLKIELPQGYSKIILSDGKLSEKIITFGLGFGAGSVSKFSTFTNDLKESINNILQKYNNDSSAPVSTASDVKPATQYTADSNLTSTSFLRAAADTCQEDYDKTWIKNPNNNTLFQELTKQDINKTISGFVDLYNKCIKEFLDHQINKDSKKCMTPFEDYLTKMQIESDYFKNNGKKVTDYIRIKHKNDNTLIFEWHSLTFTFKGFIEDFITSMNEIKKSSDLVNIKIESKDSAKVNIWNIGKTCQGIYQDYKFHIKTLINDIKLKFRDVESKPIDDPLKELNNIYQVFTTGGGGGGSRELSGGKRKKIKVNKIKLGGTVVQPTEGIIESFLNSDIYKDDIKACHGPFKDFLLKYVEKLPYNPYVVVVIDLGEIKFLRIKYYEKTNEIELIWDTLASVRNSWTVFLENYIESLQNLSLAIDGEPAKIKRGEFGVIEALSLVNKLKKIVLPDISISDVIFSPKITWKKISSVKNIIKALTRDTTCKELLHFINYLPTKISSYLLLSSWEDKINFYVVDSIDKFYKPLKKFVSVIDCKMFENITDNVDENLTDADYMQEIIKKIIGNALQNKAGLLTMFKGALQMMPELSQQIPASILNVLPKNENGELDFDALKIDDIDKLIESFTGGQSLESLIQSNQDGHMIEDEITHQTSYDSQNIKEQEIGRGQINPYVGDYIPDIKKNIEYLRGKFNFNQEFITWSLDPKNVDIYLVNFVADIKNIVNRYHSNEISNNTADYEIKNRYNVFLSDWRGWINQKQQRSQVPVQQQTPTGLGKPLPTRGPVKQPVNQWGVPAGVSMANDPRLQSIQQAIMGVGNQQQKNILGNFFGGVKNNSVVEKYKYKNKKYKIRTGPKGGKYILVEGEKIRI